MPSPLTYFTEKLRLRRNALLALADGTVFEGQAIGSECHGIGEVVFNTAMTGYQEILTDPSYSKQIVTLTVPHVGNTGVNSEDEESADIHASGLVIRDLPLLTSSFRSEGDLESYLIARNIAAIADIDTRQLTRVLREKGAQSGVIDATANPNRESAIALAREFKGLVGLDLAQHVTTAETYTWTEGTWQLGAGTTERDNLPLHVVAYDYGIKKNILRMLVDAGCRVTVVNAKMPAAEVLAMKPDGVFLSNGPGDPEPCDYAIASIQEILGQVPVFGICLGHQLLALASGAETEKMKFGHHGANHPVVDLDTRTVMISSQNHGFAVSEKSLPTNLVATHRSLFDGTLQGIRRTDVPAYSFQGHPEASPGPHDVAPLFSQFTKMMQGAGNAKA
jgi:carbamoyl-phosphate synthase small subunit